MSSAPATDRRRRVLLAAATAAVTAVSALSVSLAHAGVTDANSPAAGLYVVQFDAPPAAGYTGGIAGIPATKPVPGDRLDTRTRQYEEYRKHLRAQRSQALRAVKVDGRKVVTEYNTALNGVAINLTTAEVAKLRAAPGVRKVTRQQFMQLQTANTPTFLGLAGPGGAWARQFGDQTHAGEGVIIGVIDSGIRPESPSFAALPEPRPDADVIAAKWHGECVAGEEAPVRCNNKLIGARWYRFDDANVLPIAEEEYRSPRDFTGHGTHVAGIAAGNAGVAASVGPYPAGTISGMAPAARIAAYKVCFNDGEPCGHAEIIRAVEDAITDGVDVINYSIGSSRDVVADDLNLAFHHAAAAGVFVAAAGGNAGAPGSVSNLAPWVTTVAAGSDDRAFSKSVTLGNGTSFTGAGVGAAMPSAPLIDSPTVAAAGPAGPRARYCSANSLDPAKTHGKIVVCEQRPRTDPAMNSEVKRVGGVGIIVYEPGRNAIAAAYSHVPSIHIRPADAETVKAYIAASGSAATAALSAGVLKVARAPQVAEFSSAGPAEALRGDLLKPDIAAPGAHIVAATAPEEGGREFESYSGTSMASPHIAGLAALLKGRFPHWTPAAIKSALMTTAGQTDNTGAPIGRATADVPVPATPLDHGAGHVRPGPAFDPGLVYDSGPPEWARFVCGIGEAWREQSQDACGTAVDQVDPSDLNYPSIAVGDLAGTQTITRTVTNTTNRPSLYFAQVQAPPGVEVTVTPSVLTVLPHRSATYRVEITRATAALDTYVFGSLTWTDFVGHSVRSPIAVRPTVIATPQTLRPSGTTGSAALAVRTGFTGTLTAKPYGLARANVTTSTLVGQANLDDLYGVDFGTLSDPWITKIELTLPEGGKMARFATFAADHAPTAVFWLAAYRDGKLVREHVNVYPGDLEVTVTEPGTYSVYLVKIGGPASLETKLNSFVVGPQPAGNFTVTPASQPVTPGQQPTLTAAWAALTPESRYLGAIEYSDGSGPRELTTVIVDG